MAKPFEYIAKAVEHIGVNLKLSPQMVEHFNAAHAGIVRILNNIK